MYLSASRDLIEKVTDEKDIILKKNLLEHHDYEAANLTIFTFLKKWYGADYIIKRSLVQDVTDNNKLKLDLYSDDGIIYTTEMENTLLLK